MKQFDPDEQNKLTAQGIIKLEIFKTTHSGSNYHKMHSTLINEYHVIIKCFTNVWVLKG